MADTASIGLKVRDKVIVITGGARGIGLATATALHNSGAKVAIGDIDERKVKESGGTSASTCTANSMSPTGIRFRIF